jgi:hypothetical protein
MNNESKARMFEEGSYNSQEFEAFPAIEQDSE